MSERPKDDAPADDGRDCRRERERELLAAEPEIGRDWLRYREPPEPRRFARRHEPGQVDRDAVAASIGRLRAKVPGLVAFLDSMAAVAAVGVEAAFDARPTRDLSGREGPAAAPAYLSPNDTPHTHRCVDWPECQGEWSHTPNQSWDQGRWPSHRCPKCDKVQFTPVSGAHDVDS